LLVTRRYFTKPSAWLIGFVALAATVLDAHGVAPRDARLLESIDGPAVAPLLYLGAKHMVTGYDHLLFLAGVVFFLHRLRDIAIYVSLFTLGHSLTLLAGALGGVQANPYLIDAVIGFSVVYKAFENMGGLRVIGWQLDSRAAVLVFGLFHGLGLATKLQDLSLSPNGLVTNIVSFNAGVEIGQGLALVLVLTALAFWRTQSSYVRHAFAANGVLMSAGFVLAGYQLAGYFVTRP
jgi:hypothetical protein